MLCCILFFVLWTLLAMLCTTSIDILGISTVLYYDVLFLQLTPHSPSELASARLT
jgi:hypothetical protein